MEIERRRPALDAETSDALEAFLTITTESPTRGMVRRPRLDRVRETLARVERELRELK